MPISTIGAFSPIKKEKTERQNIKKALILRFHLYSAITFHTNKIEEYIYSESYNSNTITIPADYIIDERDITMAMPLGESNDSYLQNLFNVSRSIKNKILGELVNPLLEELIVKIYLFTIDNGDILSNIFNVSDKYDVECKIQNEFYNIIYIKHPLIKDISICGIGTYDKITQIPIESSTDSNSKTFPTLEDVKEAIILCQRTYDSQTPLETSVPSMINSAYDSILQKIKPHKKDEDEENKDYKKVEDLFKKSGWKVADKDDKVFQEVSSRLKRLSNGFYSILYVKELSYGKRRYFYCTCGTNFTSRVDWTNNILQGATGLSQQYTMSVQNAQLLNKAVESNELYFIGHSLGGGLASNNAIVTGRQAITFNAAGLNPLRLAVTGNSKITDQIRALWNWKKNSSKNREVAKQLVQAFIIKDEILNKLLSHVLDEGAIGTTHIIELDSKIPSTQKHSLMKFINSDTGHEDFYELEVYFNKLNSSK